MVCCPKNGSRSFVVLLPCLICLFAILCASCSAKSGRIVSAKELDRIEPPNGLEWMDMLEAVEVEEKSATAKRRLVREKRRQQQQKTPFWWEWLKTTTSRRMEKRKTTPAKKFAANDNNADDLFTVDFNALQDEHLQRYANSYSILEFVDEDEKSNLEEEENAQPVAWFAKWEQMVARTEKKKNNNNNREGKNPLVQKQKLRKRKPSSTKKYSRDYQTKSPALMANHRHSPQPMRIIPTHPIPMEPSRRQFRNLRSPCLRKTANPVEHRTYPRSWEHPGFEAAIPREWDWRNVSGQNFCSPNRNQHIPVYCGGCWVFGTLGALNDRFNVARKNRWPMTNLSPQEIIACNGNGTCNGGTAENVMVHAKSAGLVEEGCNNYKAVNEKCTPFARCGSCWPDNCFVIQNYTRYYIKDFGKLSGRLQMMSEIHNRGPIACSMGCTSKFDLNYTGGIYQEFGEFPVNHIVSVTGWGWDEDTKTEYWIVRNSWGDAWGEGGWFRVVTSLYKGGRGDQYNMGIERECYFADPDVSNLD